MKKKTGTAKGPANKTISVRVEKETNPKMIKVGYVEVQVTRKVLDIPVYIERGPSRQLPITIEVKLDKNGQIKRDRNGRIL
jgi:hypothetical protein